MVGMAADMIRASRAPRKRPRSEAATIRFLVLDEMAGFTYSLLFCCGQRQTVLSVIFKVSAEDYRILKSGDYFKYSV